MRSGEIVEALPFIEFCFQIDVAFVAEQLIELLLISSLWAFDFSVQLVRASFDVGLTNALVLDTPVELGLEFMTIDG